MRRALASLLLAVFSVPLIVPVLLANTDSDLPACCRRSGQHHCAMAGMADKAAASAGRPAQPKCPLFPKSGTAMVSFHAVFLGPSPQIGAPPVSPSANPKTNEDSPQIALRGSTQKRGPPSSL